MQQRNPAPPPVAATPPPVIEVRVTGIDIPFNDLLALVVKFIGVQLLFGLIAGLAYLAIRGF